MDASAQPFSWPHGALGAVSFSWDDARTSQVDLAVPVLEEWGVRGTFYVLPRAVEARLEGWRAAVRAGHEIGNHTLHHPCAGNHAWIAPEQSLEGYTLGRMEAEVLAANAEIEAHLGVAPETFAYCCRETFVGRGVATASYVPLVAKHFVAGRLAGCDGCNVPGRFDLAQTWAVSSDNRGGDWLVEQVERTVQRGGWLVFNGHDVAAAAGPQTTSTEAMRAVLRHLRARGDVWVDTVAAVARHLRARRAG